MLSDHSGEPSDSPPLILSPLLHFAIFLIALRFIIPPLATSLPDLLVLGREKGSVKTLN